MKSSFFSALYGTIELCQGTPRKARHEVQERTNRQGVTLLSRLVELNEHEQCLSVIKTASVQLSYKHEGFPIVHGWVFDIKTGQLKDLHIDFEAKLNGIQKIYNILG